MLCYDYRGIGLSRPHSLRRFAATIEDWAEYDCGAAIDWMRSHHKSSRLFGIGHSAGSVFFGGAPNADGLDGLIMIGPHMHIWRLSNGLPSTDGNFLAWRNASTNCNARILSGQDDASR